MNKMHSLRMVRRKAIQAHHGQSTAELALIAPVLAIILLGLIALGGAYGAKMTLQSATAQGARIGALQGNAGNSVVAGTCPAPNADSVDLSILKAVLDTSGIDKRSITQIQIYKAQADGSIDGTSVNSYVYPFISSTGNLVYNKAPGWPSCTRHPDEPSDSLGVHVTYAYHPIVPFFSQLALTLNDQTVQRLNPTQGAKPCPVPPYPSGITVAVNPPGSSPGFVSPYNPSNDVISWSAAPLASSYNVYQSISTVNGGVINPTPVVTVTGGGTSASIPIVIQAPTAYEVTSVNFCGESERSTDVGDGRPDAAATATAQAQATQTAQAQATQTTIAANATATAVANANATATAVANATAAAAASATVAANATATAAATGTSVDDQATTAPHFSYTGSWQQCSGTTSPCGSTGYTALYNGTVARDNQMGDTATITFSGTSISLYSALEPDGGVGAVSLDGGSPVNVDFYATTGADNQLVWTSPLLASGTHTLTLKVTGTTNHSGAFVSVDRVVIHP